MKRTVSMMLAAVLMVTALVACGKPAAPKEVSPQDYKAVIEGVRDDELNQLLPVVTSAADPQFGFIVGPFFNPEDMDTFAISLSMLIVKAYGVAIIMPKPGRQEAVVQQANAYIESQRTACQNYLQDQFLIAKAARVVTMSTGEVIMVMSEDGEKVLQEIQKAWIPAS